MRSFKVFCIGYGNCYDGAALEKICKWGNNNQVEYVEEDVTIPLIHSISDINGL